MIKLIANEKISVKALIIQKISRNFYGYLKEHQAVFYVNQQVFKTYEELNPGEVLVIDYKEEKQEGFPNTLGLDILFENTNYLIINKPAHLLSIPSTKNPYDSVYNRVLGMGFGCYIFNRLDKETQGLMLIAKNKLARIALKDFHKTYLAITNQKLSNNKGRIVAKIAREEAGIKRYVSDNGQTAITNYQFVKECDGKYYYLIHLETGRTHQIRVHFAYLNAPLINDELYGVNPNRQDLGLICNQISFIDPFTNENIKCSV